MVPINLYIKRTVNIINTKIAQTLTLVKRITKNRIKGRFLADLITTHINRLLKNEFIPNPKEHLYIEVSNICNLRCKFCAHSKASIEKKIMSNEQFFDIVNKATDFGYDSFGLTPITGEVFVDPHFMMKIEFLEKHPKVKKYHFFTNFTLVNEQTIDQIVNLKKLSEIFISLYGHNLESFSKFTGGNERVFNKLISNLEYLLKICVKRKPMLSFGLRTYITIDSISKCNSELCQIVKEIIKKNQSDLTILKEYNTWGGYISQDDVKGLGIIVGDVEQIYKNGVCTLVFYKNQVVADGRVNACACRDINVTMCIGNLKTESFDEIYSINNKRLAQILESQQKGVFKPICKNCDFYRSIYKPYYVYEKYKKKPITLKQYYQFLKR